MDNELPTDLTAVQIREILQLRGINVSEEDLAALPALTEALRHQAQRLLWTATSAQAGQGARS